MEIRTTPKTGATATKPEDTPEVPKAAMVVFDAGQGNNMSLSDCQFVDGIFITDKPQEAALIRNFIEQTGSRWVEEEFDPTNPRHVRVAHTQAPLVVQGISDPLSSKPSTLTENLLAGEPIKNALDPANAPSGEPNSEGDTGATGSAE